MLVMNMETFTLSGYQISWNKAMNPLKKDHPGAVTALSVNPADPSKAWLPDGYSQIFRSCVFGPSGFCTMALLLLRYAQHPGKIQGLEGI